MSGPVYPEVFAKHAPHEGARLLAHAAVDAALQLY
jgi:hypothetical protein